jgi:hypothetical protein
MTYYINDWIARSGFIPPMGLLIGLSVGIALVGMVVMMIFGKSFRRMTKDSKIHKF